MKRKIILTVAAVAAVAVSARAQAVQAPAGQAYTIINKVAATAMNTVTYQWYRNNNPISGATSASYTVPGIYAYGDNVEFYRLAKTQDCSGEVEKLSNTITVTFTGYVTPEGCNLVIAGICWADANVDAPNTFAARADMSTKYYQWNRLTAYSAEDPLTPAWNSTGDQSETWTNNPCPNGWRLPTLVEGKQLNSLGSTWVNANVRGSLVAGRFYGYNYATCTLPSNMSGCVFIPALGDRINSTGALANKGVSGFFWSSTQIAAGSGYYLQQGEDGVGSNSGTKAYGFSIRCVQ